MMFGAGPREVAAEYRLAQGNVAFSKIRIEVNCRRRGFVSRCRTLSKRHHAEHAEPVVIVGDASVRERVLRIECDGLLVTDDGACKAVFSKRVPVKTSTQVSFVSLRIVRAALGESQPLVHSEVRHDRFGDVRRDDVFEIQNVRKLLVKLSGPRCRFLANVEQLNGDADPFGGAPDSAVEYELDAELAPSTQRIGISTVLKYAARWSDCKTANRAESRDERVGETCAEIVWASVGLVDVEDLHRQHSQRVFIHRIRPEWSTRAWRIGQIEDRTTFEEARDVVAEIRGGLIAPLRFLAQRLHHDVVEIAGERATQVLERRAARRVKTLKRGRLVVAARVKTGQQILCASNDDAGRRWSFFTDHTRDLVWRSINQTVRPVTGQQFIEQHAE